MQLATDPVLHVVLDIVGTRSYFERLWTLQEISLSPAEKIIIRCGNFAASWMDFCGAAILLQASAIFSGVKDSRHLKNLLAVKFQDCLSSLEDGDGRPREPNFQECIGFTFSRLASEQHDRSLGILGIVKLCGPTQLLSELDYETLIRIVFQVAAAALLEEDNSLAYLRYHTVMIDSFRHPGTASWALWLENLPMTKIGKVGWVVEERPDPLSRPRIVGSVLEVSGFEFDIVEHCTDNLSWHNFSSEILKAYNELSQYASTQEYIQFATVVLLQIAAITHGDPPRILEPGRFSAWIAELSSPTFQRNKKR